MLPTTSTRSATATDGELGFRSWRWSSHSESRPERSVATASGSDGALPDAPCGVDGSARVGLLGMPGPRPPCNSRGPCAVREFALVVSSALQRPRSSCFVLPMDPCSKFTAALRPLLPHAFPQSTFPGHFAGALRPSREREDWTGKRWVMSQIYQNLPPTNGKVCSAPVADFLLRVLVRAPRSAPRPKRTESESAGRQ